MSESPVYTGKLGTAAERRLHPRHRIHSLSYVDIGSDNGGVVVDLSEEGMLVQSVGPLASSVDVRLRIQVPKSRTTIETSARVVWVSQSNRLIGMRFLKLSTEERDQIEEWIQSEIQPKVDVEESPLLPVFGGGFVERPLESDAEPPKRFRSVTELKLRELHIPIAPNIGSPGEPQHVPTLQDPSSRVREIAPPPKPPAPPKPPVESIEWASNLRIPEMGRMQQRPSEASAPLLKPNVNADSAPATTPTIATPSERNSVDGLRGFSQRTAPTLKAEANPPDAPRASAPTQTIDAHQVVDSKPQPVPLVPAPAIRAAVDKSRRPNWTVVVAALALGVVLFVFLWSEIGNPPHGTAKNKVIGTVEESTETIAPIAAEPSPTRVHRNGRNPRDGVRSDANDAVSADSSSPVEQTEPLAVTSPNPTVTAPRTAEDTNVAPPPVIRDPGAPAQTIAPPATADGQASEPVSPPVGADVQPPRIVAGHVLRPTDRFNPSHLIYRVEPIYPDDAKQQRIEGTVKIHQMIGADGSVIGAKFVSGPTLLAAAALDAAQHWHYLPALLNGQPVQTEQDIEITFRLPQ